ncbi:unnamed protein product [Parajaminaea phylloscopi]
MSAPGDLLDQITALLESLPDDLPPLSPAPTLSSQPASLAALIDHTLLAPQSTTSAVTKVAQDAQRLSAASVCVNSSMVATAAAALAPSSPPFTVCSVVGFPFGAGNTEGKVAETRRAVADGAREIDMVQNVGLAKDGQWQAIWEDVHAIVAAAQPATVKVILETCYLTRSEIAASTLVACLAGAAFVKTSTGYGTAGAKAEDIRLMSYIAHPRQVKVKASGAIRSLETMRIMVENGADRIGASGTQAIIEEASGTTSGNTETTGAY